MANPQKGEVSFEHEGKVYTLVYNTSALAKFQGLFNTIDAKGKEQIADIADLDRLVKAGSVRHYVAMFWSTLQKYHAAEIPTIEAASELMDAGGAVAVSAFLRAVGAADIDPQDLEAMQRAMVTGNPQPAQVRPIRRGGTGAKRTSRRAPAA